MQPELVPADEIVQEVESLIFDEEDVATGAASLGQQHPLRTARWDHHIGCDAPRPVVELGCGGEGYRRPAGVKNNLVPRLGDGRAFHSEAAADIAVDGENVVLTCFCPPAADHFDQLVTLLGGQVVAFGVVLVHVVQLPVVRLDVHQHLIGDGGAKLAAFLGSFGEARARPRADRPPAIVVDRAVAEHLKVLGMMIGGRSRLVEGVGEAHPVDRRLGHAADALRRFGAQGFQDRRDEVDDVPIVLAHLAARLDALGPGYDARVGGAAPVGLTLPAAEGRVAGVGPAPGVVVEGLDAAQLVDHLEVVFQ